MSLFGRLLAEITEGVVDTVELAGAIASDAVKVLPRTFDALDNGRNEAFLADTQQKIEEIKNK